MSIVIIIIIIYYIFYYLTQDKVREFQKLYKKIVLLHFNIVLL